MGNFCGNCRQYLDGKCWKKNIKVSKDMMTTCQLYRPTYEQMVDDMKRAKILERRTDK